MAQLIVNNQNKAYVVSGTALMYQPYDCEIEYLLINGNSAINTQIYPTTLDLDIRCGSANGFRFGWDRQNVAAGTWIHMNQTSFTYKNWSTRTLLSEITDTEATSIWRYDMQSGLYKDGTLIKSFTASLGNNDISSIPLYIGNSFDVTANALDTVTSELNIKLKWLQVYRSGTLILDLIPVRVGTIGYMYDKISGTLFGNVGTDPFVLGSDVTEDPNMTLVRYWDGSDDLSNGKWYDKVGNQYWTLTNATHQTGYYEFTNSSGTSATSIGTLNGALPDLGYHWKIVVDAAVKYKSSGVAIAVDFGSYGQVSNDKCAVQIALVDTSKKWSFNTKFNGNSGASTYAPSTANLEENVSNGDWVRRTVTIGVKASSTNGMDETYAIVNDLGVGISNPFSPLRFNRWESGKSYIARSLIAPSSKYPTATCIKIYSIKVYKES